MTNLKEEIEKLRDSVKDIPSIYSEGGTDALNEVLRMLEDYKIITAPKSIKLSEIVERLEKSLNNPKNKVNIYRENENEIVIKINYFARGTFVNEATIEMSNKIWDIDGLMSAKFKWLYALWIAGTQIEDDLECDE